MYRKLDESEGNVLGYEVRGKLTEEELRAFTAELEDEIARHGKLRVLVYVAEIPRLDLGAIREDLEFAR